MKKRAKSRSFITNSRNLLIALLILASAVAVYSQAQGAVVSHTPAQISPQGAGSGLDADTLQQLSSAAIIVSAAATSVVNTKPTCDASNKGKMVFVTSEDLLYVCSSNGWRVMQAAGGLNDVDKDGFLIQASSDCNDNNKDKWQYLDGYADGDLDGYGVLPLTQVCSGGSLPSGYSSRSGDCDNSCATCYPNSAEYTAAIDGNDQDCDGTKDENEAKQSKTCSSFVVPPGTFGCVGCGYVRQSVVDNECDFYCRLSNANAGGVVGPACGGNYHQFSTGFNFDTCEVSYQVYNEDSDGNPLAVPVCSTPVTCTCNNVIR